MPKRLQLKDLTVAELRFVARLNNLEHLISPYSKMSKDDLIQQLNYHLNYNDKNELAYSGVLHNMNKQPLIMDEDFEIPEQYKPKKYVRKSVAKPKKVVVKPVKVAKPKKVAVKPVKPVKVAEPTPIIETEIDFYKDYEKYANKVIKKLQIIYDEDKRNDDITGFSFLNAKNRLLNILHNKNIYIEGNTEESLDEEFKDTVKGLIRKNDTPEEAQKKHTINKIKHYISQIKSFVLDDKKLTEKLITSLTNYMKELEKKKLNINKIKEYENLSLELYNIGLIEMKKEYLREQILKNK